MIQKRRDFLGRGLLALLGLVVAILLIREFQTLPFNEWLQQAVQFSDDRGTTGIFIFIALYVVATLLLFPCALLTVAAGVMYGMWGIPIVIFSATLGAVCAFFIARYFAFEKVDRLLQKRPFTRALKSAIREEGWKFMVLLRISPLIPFNVNNYVLGVAPVTFGSYMLATVIGTIPGTTLYIYLGTFGRGQSAQQELKWTLFALGLLATIGLGRLAIHRTRVILANQTPRSVNGTT